MISCDFMCSFYCCHNVFIVFVIFFELPAERIDVVHKKEECTDQADGEIHGVPGALGYATK